MVRIAEGARVMRLGCLPLRGGDWNNGSTAGVFALNLNNVRTIVSSNVGFRPALGNRPKAVPQGAPSSALPKGNEGDYGKELFAREDFEHLARVLCSIKGKFLLSLNDVPEVRETFSAFHIEAVETAYSVCPSREGRGRVGEVIISNL